jgi:hypothetical protein
MNMRCELGYFNYWEQDLEDVKMDQYEQDIYAEAIEAFEKCVAFEPEAFAKCVAFNYLEGYSEATTIFRRLGLERRHAQLLCGHTKDFWREVREA